MIIIMIIINIVIIFSFYVLDAHRKKTLFFCVLPLVWPAADSLVSVRDLNRLQLPSWRAYRKVRSTASGILSSWTMLPSTLSFKISSWGEWSISLIVVLVWWLYVSWISLKTRCDFRGRQAGCGLVMVSGCLLTPGLSVKTTRIWPWIWAWQCAKGMRMVCLVTLVAVYLIHGR